MIGPLAALLLAASPGAAPDLSWMIDAEIPARAVAAQAEAARLDAQATRSSALREGVLARRQAALEEKTRLEAGLAEVSWGKKSETERRIVELATQVDAADVRAKQLAAEAGSFRTQAEAQRSFAAAADAEAKTRAAEAAKHRIEPGTELGTLSDARLGEARAWHERSLARAPKQLAALERELQQVHSISERGAVVARKDSVRASVAAAQFEIARIAEELRFRAASKVDESARADEMLAIAKARAAERETPAPVSTGPDKVDAMLDRVLEAQDRRAAEAAAKSKRMATLARIGGAIGGFGALGTALFLVLRRTG